MPHNTSSWEGMTRKHTQAVQVFIGRHVMAPRVCSVAMQHAHKTTPVRKRRNRADAPESCSHNAHMLPNPAATDGGGSRKKRRRVVDPVPIMPTSIARPKRLRHKPPTSMWFKCGEEGCLRMFAWRSERGRHLWRSHAHKAVLRCIVPECPFRTHSRGAQLWATHFRRRHCTRLVSPCVMSNCTATVATRGEWVEHWLQHIMARVCIPCVATHCTSAPVLLSKGEWRAHMHVHAARDNWACPVSTCMFEAGDQFTWLHHLWNHALAQTPPRQPRVDTQDHRGCSGTGDNKDVHPPEDHRQCTTTAACLVPQAPHPTTPQQPQRPLSVFV